MANLEDEVSAMRALERALAKAASLGGNAKLRALGWARDRTAELIAEVPAGPENVPAKALTPPRTGDPDD
jgi:hypothetical protein